MELYTNWESETCVYMREKKREGDEAHIEFIQAVEGAADLLAHSHDKAHVGEAALTPTQTLHVRHLFVAATLVGAHLTFTEQP
jgi:hypothetical protein